MFAHSFSQKEATMDVKVKMKKKGEVACYLCTQKDGTI